MYIDTLTHCQSILKASLRRLIDKIDKIDKIDEVGKGSIF